MLRLFRSCLRILEMHVPTALWSSNISNSFHVFKPFTEPFNCHVHPYSHVPANQLIDADGCPSANLETLSAVCGTARTCQSCTTAQWGDHAAQIHPSCLLHPGLHAAAPVCEDGQTWKLFYHVLPAAGKMGTKRLKRRRKSP